MTDEEIIKPEESEVGSPRLIGGQAKSFFGRKCKNCEKLELECAEYKAGWQRALADYKNLQNEVEKRRGEWAQMSGMQILSDFLPVYENMKKAVSHAPLLPEEGTRGGGSNQWEQWKVGVEHIMKQFNDVLKAHGLEEIKTVGEQLDLRFHEAVGEEESDKPAGTIIKEVETGYVMGGRVVKAAKVVVAR